MSEDEKTRVSVPILSPSGSDDHGILIQIYGPKLGERYSLDGDIATIGRDLGNNIVLVDESVSRNHAKIERTARGFVLEDLDSTNGSRVNDDSIKSCLLKSGDQLQIGSFILKYIGSGNVEAVYHEEIYRMMITDGLTGIANRRKLDEAMENEFLRAKRYGRPLSIAILDADHFKKVNDTHGHIVGDFVLKKLATLFQQNIRREELLGRYGGEEFVVVMPEVDSSGAFQLAEKLRKTVEGTVFKSGEAELPVTISVGVATLGAEESVKAFLDTADQALYKSKEDGRNRVTIGGQG
ncbi:MAG: GGDEF domain-containing protein [Myxococcota bacterium]|nr:GGDEF domain-containing protein [Myxococcota bacterium]